MTKIVAIQADPLLSLNPKTDTTLKLAEEAQRRGAKLLAYTPNHLTYNQGKLFAKGQFFHFGSSNHLEIQDELIDFNLSEADFVLIRQNPPVDKIYLTNTYLLEQLPKKVCILNNPKGLRIVSEKLFTLNFPRLIPPTLVASDEQQLVNFINDYQQVILKPLYEYGGRGILYLHSKDPNIEALLELYHKYYPEGVMLQQYLPEVKQGDKRIILINGQPVGSYLRQPASHQIRSNLRVGGKALPCKLSARDHEICETLAPFLKGLGMYLVGLDVIGYYLTEVNVTSPTGFCSLENLYGIKAAEVFWEGLGI
jgi:glutathione synthase